MLARKRLSSDSQQEVPVDPPTGCGAGQLQPCEVTKQDPRAKPRDFHQDPLALEVPGPAVRGLAKALQ